ncbi:hypothetical protein GAY28_26640, partial [Azospirillum brasilense]|nr:hypothetical protein [Azospirillum brasilense]
MTTTPDDNGAMAVRGAAGHAAPPHRDPDLQAQVWAILDAAIERGEEPPPAPPARPVVRGNNSQGRSPIAPGPGGDRAGAPG